MLSTSKCQRVIRTYATGTERSLFYSIYVLYTIKALFVNFQGKQVKNFCAYLDQHRHRIVDYEYYQAEQLCSIDSGAVESAIKVLGKRIKISGAQWKTENVNQVLSVRCAYMNGLLAI